MKKQFKILFALALFPLHLLAQSTESEAITKQALVEPMDTIVFPYQPTAEDSASSLPPLDSDSLPWPQNVQQRLDVLTRLPFLQRSQLGLLVYDLTADSVVYRYNERQTLRPASTQKLVTAITALDRLGGDYKLRTSLYYTGSIVNRTLQGNLYCVGGMDPLFSDTDLREFILGVKRLGIDTIRGRLVADRTFKDADLKGEGWCWDDKNPDLSPLLINRKDDFLDRLSIELRRNGIGLDVQLTEGPLPRGATLVSTCTHSIDLLLAKMMKDSDNLFAEALLYQLAASGGAPPARASHARAIIQRLIQQLGLRPEAYKIADGSGLSLYNYVTPELEVRLLRYAWHTPAIQQALLPTLPVAAVDGTLRSRMSGPYTSGNVRAKTGTVTGISSLAGYCTAANGHQLCFCIINQGILNSGEGRQFQDRVCTALCAPASVSVATATSPAATVKAAPARRPTARPAAPASKKRKQKASKRRRTKR